MEFLNAIFLTLQQYQFRLFWPELLFMIHLPKRSFYWLRSLVWIPFLIVPFFFSTFFTSPFFKLGFYNWSFLLWFVYSIFAVCFCHKTNVSNFIFALASAYTIQNLFVDFKFFIYYMLSPDETLLYNILTFLLMVGIYAITYFLFTKPWSKKINEGLKINHISLVVISIFILLFLNVLSSVLVNITDNTKTLAIICLLFSICSLFVLMLLSTAYDKSYFQYETESVKKMLDEFERQRKISEQTIDIINMKCHDMKHQLMALRSSKENIDDDFYKKAVDSIAIYDSFFKTGNESLDLVLTEKSLLCNKENIRLTCVADGEAISFMKPSDVYSFFGNAIDNAMECLVKYDKSKRDLSIIVRKTNTGFVSITIENYCQEDAKFVNGLPKITKNNVSFHGFGTKSMKYIIEDIYHGTILMERKKDAFCVSVLIQIDQEKTK